MMLIQEVKKRKINVNAIIMQTLLKTYSLQESRQILNYVKLKYHEGISDDVLTQIIEGLEEVLYGKTEDDKKDNNNTKELVDIAAFNKLKQRVMVLEEAMREIMGIIERVGGR